eukprot:5137472-Pleurochrysis_carterae.AAC.3
MGQTQARGVRRSGPTPPSCAPVGTGASGAAARRHAAARCAAHGTTPPEGAAQATIDPTHTSVAGGTPALGLAELGLHAAPAKVVVGDPVLALGMSVGRDELGGYAAPTASGNSYWRQWRSSALSSQRTRACRGGRPGR